MARCQYPYLDIKLLVDFHDVTEQCDVLHEVCKLPHVAQPVQRARFLWGIVGLDFVVGPLSGYHVGRGACRAATREGGRRLRLKEGGAVVKYGVMWMGDGGLEQMCERFGRLEGSKEGWWEDGELRLSVVVKVVVVALGFGKAALTTGDFRVWARLRAGDWGTDLWTGAATRTQGCGRLVADSSMMT